MVQPVPPSGRPGDVLASFEAMPLGLASLAGPELRFVAANAGFRHLVGRDVIGRTVADVLPDLAPPEIVRQVIEVARSGEPQRVDEWRVMLGGPRGEPVERYLTALCVPAATEDGVVVGVDAYVLDVTESVRARHRQGQRAERAGARLVEARSMVVAFQDALLPPGLPVLPRCDIAARYLLADAEVGAGGDWFDAMAMTDGRLALTVGDVVGHGVEAAAVMGQMRAVLGSSLCETGDPVSAMRTLDAFARTHPAARAATAASVVLDPVSGRLDYVTAGHVPPMRISATGDAVYLEGSGSGRLGVGGDMRGASATLDVGDLLVLYTDGIVERPGEETTAQMVALLEVAAGAARGVGGGGSRSSAERVCETTVEVLTRRSGYIDDVTMLAAQRQDPVPPLALSVPALPGAVADIRRALHRWLDALRVSSVDHVALTHGTGELVTNVVEHAYADGPTGDVLVRVALDDGGRVTVEVADAGCWRVPSAVGNHGRGLMMARAFADELTVDHAASGTTARLVRRVSRPIQLLQCEESVADRPPPALELETVAVGRIVMRGFLDLWEADDVALVLSRRQFAAGGRLALDLSGLSTLTSGGVRMLSDLVAGGGVTLYAAPGTAAHHVLDLVRLDHRWGSFGADADDDSPLNRGV